MYGYKPIEGSEELSMSQVYFFRGQGVGIQFFLEIGQGWEKQEKQEKQENYKVYIFSFFIFHLKW
jgi:hypothetical protein